MNGKGMRIAINIERGIRGGVQNVQINVTSFMNGPLVSKKICVRIKIILSPPNIQEAQFSNRGK